MVRFINKFTGTEMWVAEERVEEYKAAGHKYAPTPAPLTPVSKPKKAPAKKTKK
ncbi:MAG: hypothetical protein IJH28_05400 [Mogibacterium sp.]|nr:hypothetical protein [Mogibacterium sp.]